MPNLPVLAILILSPLSRPSLVLQSFLVPVVAISGGDGNGVCVVCAGVDESWW